MKKRFAIVVAMILAMAMVLAACSNNGAPAAGSSAAPAPAGSSAVSAPEGGSADTPEAPADEVVEISIANVAPAGSMQAGLFDRYAAAIEEESGGSLKVTLYQAGTLITADQFYESVVDGRVDIADFPPAYYSPYLPELRLLCIPGLYRGHNVHNIIEALRDPVDALLQTKGLKLVASYGSTTENWFIGSKVVKNPTADLANITMRVSGEENGLAAEKWGAAPVSIPITDLPTALERNTVDMAMTTWTMIDGMQLYSMANGITATDVSEPFVGLVMNMEKWNSLSQNQQEALNRAGERFTDDGYETATARVKELITIMEDAGVEFYEALSDEDFAFYHDTAMELVTEMFPEPNELEQGFLDAIETLQ